MTAHNSGPTTAATVDEARKSDQLDGSIASDNNVSANADQAQLIKTIKAHIAKGEQAAKKSEQHFISAGKHLAVLKKEHAGPWAEWEVLLKTKVGISTGRASELMQIADGRKTVEALAAASTERSKKHRALSSLRNEEDADTPEADRSARLRNQAYRRRNSARRRMPALKAKQLKAEQLKAAVDPENTDEAQRRADEAQRRHDAEREAWLKKREAERRERLDAEADSVASELIALNRDTARRIHDLLWRDSNERLMRALARALGLDDDGNGVDAEASAEAMKAKHAAAEFVEEFVLDLKDEAAS